MVYLRPYISLIGYNFERKDGREVIMMSLYKSLPGDTRLEGRTYLIGNADVYIINEKGKTIETVYSYDCGFSYIH